MLIGFASSKVIRTLEINIGLLSYLGNSEIHFHILIASSFFLFFILFSLFFPFFFFLFEFVWKFLFTRVSNTSMNLRPCMGLAIMLLSHTNFVKDKALQYVLHHCA